MPSPSVDSTTSAQRSALTSLRRIPAINSSPARRGNRHRGARGRASDVVQLGEVRRERRVVELATVEPAERTA